MYSFPNLVFFFIQFVRDIHLVNGKQTFPCTLKAFTLTWALNSFTQLSAKLGKT